MEQGYLEHIAQLPSEIPPEWLTMKPPSVAIIRDGRIPQWYEYWVPSTVTDQEGRTLTEAGLVTHLIIPSEQPFPLIQNNRIVIFESFLYCGLGLPASLFLVEVLSFYNLEISNLKPNGILHLSLFATLCECWAGILPRLDVWRYFFKPKFYTVGKTKTYTPVSFVSFNLRPRRKYPQILMKKDWKDAHRRWIMMALPEKPEIQGTLMLRPVTLINTEPPAVLDSQGKQIVKFIGELAAAGLTTHHMGEEFLRRGEQPLMRRDRPMWELPRVAIPRKHLLSVFCCISDVLASLI